MSTENPASTVLEDSWQLHYAKWKSGAQPLKLETEKFISSLHILRSSSTTDAPWNIRCKTDTSLTSTIHSTEEVRTKRLQVQHLLENYSKSIQVYTDASVKITGRAGAAFCIPDLSIEAEIRVADGTSVVTGELLAIYAALKFMENTEIRNAEIAIITDSMSAIRLLADYRLIQNGIELSIIQSIETLKRMHEVDTNIVWIPGHIGIAGNDRADNLAKKASEKRESDIENEITIKEIFGKIDYEIEAEWQRIYTNSSTARMYKQIEPKVSTELKFINKNRKKEVVITRLRLGKCLLNSCLHQINKHDTGLCDTCKVPETVEHFLLYCQTANIFYGSKVTTLKEALNNEKIDKIYDRIRKLKRKI